MIQTSALERLRDLFRRDKGFVTARVSEWFYTYHADLYVHGVSFDVYVEKVRAIRREMGGARRVLDLGGGFGVYSALLRIFGIPEVVSLDYHAQKVRDARRLMEYLGLDGVRILRGDGTALPFRPGTFQGALALACLSHIREPEQALGELGRALAPGGRLYVFEDNNSTFPGYEKNMSRVWEEAEHAGLAGHDHASEQRREAYSAMRRRMIAERYPDLPPRALDHCAEGTRGLYGRGIFRAVEEFRTMGRLRNPRRKWVCDPVSGEFEELPLNPFLVGRMLRRAGFEPRLKCPLTGPFRGRRRLLKRLAAGVLSICPAILPWVCPIFSMTASRRRG